MRRFPSIPEWVEENLFKHPQKDDPLFHPDPHGAPTNASLEVWGGDPAYACARGYRVAAQLAVEHIRQRQLDRNFLVFPVVFLYRHHIELMLKHLILKADRPSVRRITDAERLSEAVREKLSKTHSLQWLWDQLRPVVQALEKKLVTQEDVKGINSYIRQLNEVDPNSVHFRYTTDIEETKAKLGEGRALGIQNFAAAMERLANFLEGLDCYLDEEIDLYHQVLADSTP